MGEYYGPSRLHLFDYGNAIMSEEYVAGLEWERLRRVLREELAKIIRAVVFG